jgi:hypothetical protein
VDAACRNFKLIGDLGRSVVRESIVGTPVYGYMCVGDDQSDRRVMRNAQMLERLATNLGMHLETIFYEFNTTTRTAYYEMIEAIERNNVRNVLVPTFDHLSSHPLPQIHRTMHLELDHETDIFDLRDFDG